MAELLPAEQQIAQTLQAGHILTVRWDCGGDESFVYTEVDGQEVEADYDDSQDIATLLDQYLTEKLDLPSAGDFSMRGTGRIFQKNREVFIDYQSESWVDADWMDDFSDEELADMGCSRPDPVSLSDPDSTPTYSPDDDYTGRLVLFTLP